MKAGASRSQPGTSVRVSLFPLQEEIDPAHVSAASQYVILAHLVRNLVRYNSVGDIEGDLATSWKSDPDFKVYEFRLVTDARFSDGSLITPADVVATFKAQMKRRTATHLDFGQIRSVEKVGSDTIRVVLNSRSPNFISQLVHPECGILYHSDLGKEVGKYSFNPSSGPYSLESGKISRYVMKRNPFFPGFDPKAPQELTIEYFPSANEQLRRLEGKDLDFAIPFDLTSFDSIRERLKKDQISTLVPHIGFTFWLTLNPDAPALRDIHVRNRIQALIHRHEFPGVTSSSIPWTRAEQLYLPDGVGRPTAQDLKRAWLKIERSGEKAQLPGRIRLLTGVNFPFNKDLIHIFSAAGVGVSVDYCHSLGEMVKKARAGHYDAFLINNDFSSVDLLENILTTFNAADPLIFLPSPDHPIARWVKEANSLQAGDARHALFQKISLNTLEDGLVAPLCYRRIAFLHQRTLDISAWSSVFPEIAFWKARIISP